MLEPIENPILVSVCGFPFEYDDYEDEESEDDE